MTVRCPALLVAAPASGQGKTTVTAALARWHRQAGRRVRVFKCGPDFLDPQILAVASGQPVFNLDLGMMAGEEVAWRLADAARTSDLILVEGVMGLVDGRPSAADIAERFRLPILAVIDGSAMAQTFGALAHGLASYRPGLPFAGALANRVGSPGHGAMLAESLPAGMTWFGALPRNEAALPERHLGLFTAREIPDLDVRLDRLAAALGAATTLDLPAPVSFPDLVPPKPPRLLAGRRIAVARDAAFAFLYPANLETLSDLGAELRFFSPLAGDAVPECEALWLPGGYPELHGPALGANPGFFPSLRAHHEAGRPILAECGGMMSLFGAVVDGAGAVHPFAGLLPGRATLQPRLAALGLQRANFDQGVLTGHTFHYSRSETSCPVWRQAAYPDGRQGEAIYRSRGLTASYMHFYFPSSPAATAALFGAAA